MWRLLDDHEIVREEDSYWDWTVNEWHEATQCTHVIGQRANRYGSIFRRVSPDVLGELRDDLNNVARYIKENQGYALDANTFAHVLAEIRRMTAKISTLTGQADTPTHQRRGCVNCGEKDNCPDRRDKGSCTGWVKET